MTNRGRVCITGLWVIFCFHSVCRTLSGEVKTVDKHFFFPCLLSAGWWEVILPHAEAMGCEPVFSGAYREREDLLESNPGALVINVWWTDAPQCNSMFYWMKGKTTPKYIHWCLLLSYAKYSINYDTACILDNINASLQKMWQRNPQLLLR